MARAKAKPDEILDAEQVTISELTPHPRNYRKHPPDQLEHLAASIRQHGFYRNVVIAKDGTILAGHGIVEAAASIGITAVPAVRLDLDPDSPAALKVLAADNELGRFAEVDDRSLTELLREIGETDIEGLLGTGYDEMILANLLMVTRTAGEISGFDAAAEWAGMPDYEAGTEPVRLMISFETIEDRTQFLAKDLDISLSNKPSARLVSGWYPARLGVHDDGGLKYMPAARDV